MVANFRSPFTLVSFAETRVVHRPQYSNETTRDMETHIGPSLSRRRKTDQDEKLS
jgi:hypothetical protein